MTYFPDRNREARSQSTHACTVSGKVERRLDKITVTSLSNVGGSRADAEQTYSRSLSAKPRELRFSFFFLLLRSLSSVFCFLPLPPSLSCHCRTRLVPRSESPARRCAYSSHHGSTMRHYPDSDAVRDSDHRQHFNVPLR